LSLNTSLNGFSFIQELNNVTARNDRNSQRIGLSLRTSNKDWPSIEVAYNHGFNQIKGIQNSDFQSQNFNATFDYEIIKHWILKSEYNWNKNIFDNRMDSFDNLDFSLACWILWLLCRSFLNLESILSNDSLGSLVTCISVIGSLFIINFNLVVRICFKIKLGYYRQKKSNIKVFYVFSLSLNEFLTSWNIFTH
jgi:hypothetical protein